ncbi:hypothetical protein [Sulfurimonas sp.]|jgi:lipid-binding SYLF domain-containing protein|uniref:lipid-binding SYLF domain-containing protein n=1 Tax=Sulfurimonas sp. TaxID=2022749 RepID=UPI0025FB2D43|nr:hypothetical protein [Sulfurimonas sp.]MBT5934564.1 hypothetical protein [Sulfurimonas sp.]
MKNLKVLMAMSIVFVMFSGFWSGETPAELIKEREIENAETLKLLYKHTPKAKILVESSYGYATFTNVGLYLPAISIEGGSGLAHNNKSGKDIYMNMGSAGIGFGLGIKDFRAIFIFKNKQVFDSFVEEGWEANAQADAAAKSGEKGGALNAAVTVAPGIKLYRITVNGLAVQVNIQGTKYWKDGDLN